MPYEPNILYVILAVVTALIVLVGSWICRSKPEQRVFPLKRGECDTCGQHSVLFDGLCSICRKTYHPEDKK